VRELHAYLPYRPQSTLTMKQAISNGLMEANCTRLSENRFMSPNLPQGNRGQRPTANTDRTMRIAPFRWGAAILRAKRPTEAQLLISVGAIVLVMDLLTAFVVFVWPAY
jgi:hypothetical protein